MVEIFLATIGAAKLCATFQTNGAVTNFAQEIEFIGQALISEPRTSLWERSKAEVGKPKSQHMQPKANVEAGIRTVVPAVAAPRAPYCQE